MLILKKQYDLNPVLLSFFCVNFLRVHYFVFVVVLSILNMYKICLYVSSPGYRPEQIDTNYIFERQKVKA